MLGQVLGRDAILARGRHHRGDPGLQRRQTLRLELEPVLVAAQRVAGLAQLDLRALKQLRGLLQPGIDAGQGRQARADRFELRQERQIAVVERSERRPGALDQARGVGQPAVLLVELLPLLGPAGRRQGQRPQLLDLPGQRLAFARTSLGIALGAGARLFQLVPEAIALRHLARHLGQAGVLVEQGALRLGAEQRMMDVLAVNVGEEVRRLAQLPQGRRRAIHVGARASAGIDDAAQQQRIAIGLEIVA
ncbi:hypothetical protein GALL_281890 [mine drainage metagenome]|uniref:Uncharacterized protein n=1 Tax=mine drainage metagenome TaxID=410659 RepID=A0A1J5R1U9_9ZZZZ